MTSVQVCNIGPGNWPEAGNSVVPCCIAVANDGPGHCTCWEPVFDLAQAGPRADLEAATRTSMCVDCAYRPKSPERTGDPNAVGDEHALQALVDTGSPFWCHQGMRRPTHWVHPSGAIAPASDLNYQPPIVETVPYKADGTPADICGGWSALSEKATSRLGGTA